MNDSLLQQAFLAALPECIKVSGWTGRDGDAVRSIDSRVQLAWDIATTACQTHPTRPPRCNDWNAAIDAALKEIKATLGDGYEAERRVEKLLVKSEP